jgi:hypothetical protein
MRYLVCLALIVTGQWSGVSAAPPGKEPVKVRPVLWWSGLNPVSDGGSGGGGQKIVLVTDAKAFAKLTRALELKGPCPQVNFKEYFVLVVHKPLGLDLSQPFGFLAVDGQGEAKVRGLPVHPDSMNSAIHSSPIAVFPRSGIKTVEGKKLPPGPA